MERHDNDYHYDMIMILPLVSMYVPVHPADRKKFLNKIKNSNRKIPQGAIVGGDSNCVENITFDTLKLKRRRRDAPKPSRRTSDDDDEKKTTQRRV